MKFKKILLLTTTVLTLSHTGMSITAADQPKPVKQWFDHYSEIQVYDSNYNMIDDLVKYHVDDRWYSTTSQHVANPNHYRKMILVKIK